MRVVALGERQANPCPPPPPPATTTPAPARLAWAFSTATADARPALALLGEDGTLRALALPSLTPLPPTAGLALEPALGLGRCGGGAVLGAAAPDGSILLVGPAGEWVRVGLGGVEEEEAPPPTVAPAAAPPPPPLPPPSHAAALLPALLRDAATGVLGSLAAAAAGPTPPPLPRLEAVLGGPRLVAVAAVAEPEPAAAMAPPSSSEDAAARAALLAGASRPAGRGGRPAPRSAADIRAAYGRPLPREAAAGGSTSGGVAGAVASVLGEAAAALGRRGEALAGLAARTGEMAEDAAGFEAMARAIRAREERKKWWQF